MNVARLLRAIEFAAHKHRTQRRKSGEQVPYINHPITVARLIADVGRVEDDDVLIAAVLHDTVEDTDTTPEELEAAFGPAVRRLVEEVTDDKSLPKAERKRLQIEHANQLSPEAALIKLADKIANIGDLCRTPPADWSRDRCRQYVDWGEAVVGNLPPVNGNLEQFFEATVRVARQALPPQ